MLLLNTFPFIRKHASLLVNQSVLVPLVRCSCRTRMSSWMASGSSGSTLSRKFLHLVRLHVTIVFHWSFIALSNFLQAKRLQLAKRGCRAKHETLVLQKFFYFSVTLYNNNTTKVRVIYLTLASSGWNLKEAKFLLSYTK